MPGLFGVNGLGRATGSGAFNISVLFVVFVFVAFATLSFRLNNEIERLHWQLTLSQYLNSDSSKEISPEAKQNLLKNGQVVQDNIRGAEIPLKKAGSQLFHAEETVSDEVKEKSACTETGFAYYYLRYVVGFLLIVFVVTCSCIWSHLDSLVHNIPDWLSRWIGHTDKSRPVSEVVAYKIDLWFSTHKHAKVMALLAFTFVLVIFGSLALFAVSDISIWDAVWQCLAGVGVDWTFALDWIHSSGIFSIFGRLVSVLISLGGLLVTALLLGIVSDIISQKVDDMKKGTSCVLESNHSLILGWSDEVVPIIKQLCLANESLGGAPIVVLCEKEKEDMETEISRNEIDYKGSRIICRNGNPLLRCDLEKVAVSSARSIIVLANQDSPDQSDARVLRIVLSLKAVHETDALKGYIVAEICDIDNESLVKIVGRDMVETVVSHDIIGRLMIQCAQQPGLARVWEELMGFDGCEFYFKPWNELNGNQFQDALISFPNAIPVGVKRKTDGTIRLNPEDDYIFQEGDELIVIAEDDNTYKYHSGPSIIEGKCPTWLSKTKTEKILFCGWRRDMDDLIKVLDGFVLKGSELWLYSDIPTTEREAMLIQGGLTPETDLKNLTLNYKSESLKGDLITRKKLVALDPASFSSILILADESATGDNIADADSRNLATLLLLRDIIQNNSEDICPTDSTVNLIDLETISSQRSAPVIVSEILDARTRYLVAKLNISEFVMSNELVSMALAMVAENADVNCVLQELFSTKGCELCVFPAKKYLNTDEGDLSFFELMKRSRQHNEIAIGYRSKTDKTILVNPANKAYKQLNLEVVKSVIVLAHQEQIEIDMSQKSQH